MRASMYRVKKSYGGSSEDPLIVRKGDRLRFERRRSEWPGWIWCTSDSGKTGWVPESWVKLEGQACIMTRDYSAFELTVSTGDELSATVIESGWAWVTNSLGESGWVPLNHLETV